MHLFRMFCACFLLIVLLLLLCVCVMLQSAPLSEKQVEIVFANVVAQPPDVSLFGGEGGPARRKIGTTPAGRKCARHPAAATLARLAAFVADP